MSTHKTVTTAASVLLITVITGCVKDGEGTYLRDQSKPLNLHDIIAFTKVSTSRIEADSVSRAMFEVTIDPQTAPANRKIVFRCSGGVFDNNDTAKIVPPNFAGIAVVPLVSKQPGIATVSASISSYKVDTTINVIPSLPDYLAVKADNYSGNNSTNFTVTTELFKNQSRGLISNPLKVGLEVTPNTLKYDRFSFSTNDVATFVITNPFNVRGTFKVKTFVSVSNGSVQSDSLDIIIQ